MFADSLFGQVMFFWLMYTCYFMLFFAFVGARKMFSCIAYLLIFIGVPSFNMLGFFISRCNACAFLYGDTL